VWIDLLGVQGDPRAEHISLEHAIAAADPERALELSRAQAEVCREHRKAIWNRPGGFPFREKYRGREHVAFQSDWDHKIRGKVATIFDRVQRFTNHVTDVQTPLQIQFGRPRDVEALEPTEPTSALEEQVIATLGNAAVYAGGAKDPRVVVRDVARVPFADEDGFRALCIANPQLTAIYRFELVWPGTRIVLPHHEGAHYADGIALTSSLSIHFAERELKLMLRFPFESFEAPGFVDLYETICDTLGKVMTPTRFHTFTPTADGNRMTRRLARYNG
jgi:hypothetical protein